MARSSLSAMSLLPWVVAGCLQKRNPLYGLTDSGAGRDSTGSVGSTTGGEVASESSADSGSTTSDPSRVELCNDVDDDGDGLVDEVSAINLRCDECELRQREGFAIWVCDGPLPWLDAEADCVARGGHLVSIHDGPTHEFYVGFIDDVGFLWIGLQDFDVEFEWVWSDGTPFDYDRWQSGQPDDAGGKEGEDCGQIRTEPFGYTWNDGVCSNALAYACAVPHDEA